MEKYPSLSNGNNMSKNKFNYCRICANSGFPSERITFKDEGTKLDGSTLWVLYDYSRPLVRHIHKPNIQDKAVPNLQVQYIDTIGPLIAEIYRILPTLTELLEEILEERHKTTNK